MLQINAPAPMAKTPPIRPGFHFRCPAARQREKDAATASHSRHSTWRPSSTKLGETDQKPPVSVDGPQHVNAPNDRTALFDRLHSCLLGGAVPHMDAGRVKTARLLRMQSEIQAAAMGGCAACASRGYIETVR